MGNSQNYLSMSTHKARELAILTVIIFTLAAVQAASAQNDGGEIANKLRQNTVRISAAEDGFGFVTGERGEFLYIATAKHVLGKDDTPDSKMPETAKVTFFSHQGESFDAEIVKTFEGDLAVLKVKKPAGFEWIKDCLAGADSERFGTKVWFVGRLQSWFVPPKPGAISSNGAFMGHIEVEDLNVQRGTSGAPLITSQGIIGMILEKNVSTDVLAIEAIQQSFKEWNHPWDLSSAQLDKDEKDPKSILRKFKTLFVDAHGAQFFGSDQMKQELLSNKDFASLNIQIVDDPKLADVVLQVNYTALWDYPFELKHQETSFILLAGKGKGPLSGPVGARDVAQKFVSLARPFRTAQKK